MKDDNEKSNPKDSIQDQSSQNYDKNRDLKTEHDTLTENTKEDILDKKTNQKPRDNI